MAKKSATIISFHGEQKVKDKYLARVNAHYIADEIVKGQYWKNGKGCAVGCTIHSGRHDDYPVELGVCWQLALLEDSIFEKLPNDQAKEWPKQFLEAIPVGVDTLKPFNKFILWNLSDEKDGLLAIMKDGDEKKIIEEVVSLYKKIGQGKKVSQEKWKDLADRAYKLWRSSASASAYAYAYAYASASAAASAYAYAAAAAAAAADAYAYAASAYAAYAASAYAYAASALGSENWQKAFDERIIQMRDKLLEFLKEAK